MMHVPFGLPGNYTRAMRQHCGKPTETMRKNDTGGVARPFTGPIRRVLDLAFGR
jgi:hypothetical protein